MLVEGRFEKKIVLRASDAKIVKDFLKIKVPGLSTPFPDRFINNLYFDSFDFKSARQNIEGIGDRKKLRLRWYGNKGFSGADCFLECKAKETNLVLKEVFSVGKISEKVASDLSKVNEWLLSRPLPMYMREWLQSQSIAIFNSYCRKYLLSRSGAVRLTIDENIKSLPIINSRVPAINLEKMLLKRHQGTVIEVKYNPAYEVEATAIMKRLELPVTKFSKYVAGLI